MADAKSIMRLPHITSRMQRALNMKVALDKGGYRYQFKVSGFRYDDFDRAGYISAIKVNRMLEMNRFVSSGRQNLFKTSRTMFYVLGNHLSFFPEIYCRASINLPMIYDSQVVGIGKTSMDLCHTLFAESLLPVSTVTDRMDQYKVPDSSWKDALLAQRVLRVINVDAKTKRPVPIDENYRQSLGEFTSSTSASSESSGSASFPTEIKLTDKVPENHFSCEVTVRYEDLDCFFHANQGSYLAYVAEGSACAAAAGYLKNFTGDTAFRNIRKITNFYSMESLPGDHLKVSIWEDPEDSCVLYSLVSKDGKTVFRSKCVYYPEVND